MNTPCSKNTTAKSGTHLSQCFFWKIKGTVTPEIWAEHYSAWPEPRNNTLIPQGLRDFPSEDIKASWEVSVLSIVSENPHKGSCQAWLGYGLVGEVARGNLPDVPHMGFLHLYVVITVRAMSTSGKDQPRFWMLSIQHCSGTQNLVVFPSLTIKEKIFCFAKPSAT